MVIRTYLLSTLAFAIALAAPRFARADDSCAGCVTAAPPSVDADSKVAVAKAPMRIGVYGLGGYGALTRPDESVAGLSIGAELGIAFDGANGIRAGYSDASGIFGPEVRVWDLDYSHQWNTAPRLRGVTGTFGVLVGPSVGYVDYEGDDPQQHFAFGGRAGLFADLNLWNFTLGLDASARLGFSDYGAETTAMVGVHAGLTFDVARR